MRSSPPSPETKYCTLQEATHLLNANNPPYLVTIKDLLRCASLNKIQIYFNYEGGLFINLDPFSDAADMNRSYSYKGKLAILDYKYGAERDHGYFVSNIVFPTDPPNPVPDEGSPMLSDISNVEKLSFSPFIYTSSEPDDDGCFPVHVGTEVFFSDIKIDSRDLPTAIDSVTSLKRDIEDKHKNEGRYALEDAASFIANISNATTDEIERLLFSSIKQGNPRAYSTDSLIPISSRSKFDSIGAALLYEMYWDNLNDWLKDEIPRLDFIFSKPGEISAAKVGTVKSGLDKRKVMAAFQGIKWDYDHWGKNLATPSDKLKACRVSPGNKKTSALWNPADIALYLLDEGEKLNTLDAVFVSLNDWADEWKKNTELERD